jgi:hypothetical protein
MELSSITRIIRDNFTYYSDLDYHDVYGNKPKKCRRYYHNEEEFKIIVFEDDTVYQLGTEGETIGVELETPADLSKRFKSFTGEKYKIDYRLNQR